MKDSEIRTRARAFAGMRCNKTNACEVDKYSERKWKTVDRKL